MKISSLNSSLYRNISRGDQYANLLPKSNCEPSNLGSGDTYFSVNAIKSAILEYYPTVKKLAAKLKGATLKQTVANNYKFLYDHFQYSADGLEQKLRSPGCSWAERAKGIDCKSYSIFAGCLLLNQGYKFYIRQIKQAGMKPENFSHVYIKIPQDQKTGKLGTSDLVIDGTKSSNTEGNYTAKHDTFMNLPHIGLKGTSETVSASCLDFPQNDAFFGKAEPVSPAAIQNFEEFLKFLENVIKIDPLLLAKFKAYAYYFIKQGLNPYFSIDRSGITVNNKKIPYAAAPGKQLCGLNGQPLRRKPGLNGDIEEQLGDELSDYVDENIDETWFENTFMAIFENGFDFSCYGSSNSVKLSKEQVALDAPYFLKTSGLTETSKGGVNTANFNRFIELTDTYIKHREYGASNNDLVKCTREGNRMGFELMSEFQIKILMEVKRLLEIDGGKLEANGTKKISNYNWPIPSNYHHGDLNPQPNLNEVTVRLFKVTAKKPIVVDPNTGSNPTGGGTPSNPTIPTTPTNPNTGGGSFTSNNGSTPTGSGSTSTLPAEYQNLSTEEKRIYTQVRYGGGISFFWNWVKKFPTQNYSDRLLKLLGITQAQVAEAKQNNAKPQTAGGGNLLTWLIVGGIAYGAYKQNQKKKKSSIKTNTKKLTA